jgi:hypothetical protein
VIELSKKSWLVAGMIPGVERQPLKKLAADENELLKLLERWRAEAEKAGHRSLSGYGDGYNHRYTVPRWRHPDLSECGEPIRTTS